MKKKILIGVGVVVAILFGVFLYGALVVSKKSPIDTVTHNNGGLDVKVVYCRPYKKGRLIFGEEKDKALQPYGKYWRLGANAATEITFDKDVTFGGKPVKSGTYRMYAIPAATSWQVVLNSQVGVYFAINEPDHKLDVISVEEPVETAPEIEQLTINFTSDSTNTVMNLAWDKALVRVPITVQ